MIPYRTLVILSVVVLAASGLVSAVSMDWMRLILNVVTIVVLVHPYRTNAGFVYRREVVWLALVPSALMAVVHALDLFLPIEETEFLDVPILSYLKAVVLAVQSYIVGVMAALIADRRGTIVMDISWIALFAMVFAMCLSAVDLLFTFLDMYVDGYPVFNEDFTAGEVIVTNRILMCSPVVTTFVSLAMMLVQYAVTRGKRVEDVLIVASSEPERDYPEEAECEETSEFLPLISNAASVGVAVVLILLVVTSNAGSAPGTCLISAVLCLVSPVLAALRLVRLPPLLTVLIFLSAGLHCYGLVASVYGFTGAYDVLTHTLSSLTVGTCVFYALMCFQVYSHGRLYFTGNGLAALTAIITLAFSTYWEVMEFFSDVVTGGNSQYSPFDTLSDLLCDVAGMAIASALVGLALKKWTVPQLVASFKLDDRIKSMLDKDKPRRRRR